MEQRREECCWKLGKLCWHHCRLHFAMQITNSWMHVIIQDNHQKNYYNLLYELVNCGQKTFLTICTSFYRGTAVPLFCPHPHG